ncbi:type 1 glutamine amidotransferase [Novispirillum sp. DQ9]|uniref:type 1 glutamine amidotransferase n=1 Tax=Novispirillum sp. DQ9 TaxID=3398612 RepID=UPI003C7B9D0A
MTKPHLLVVEGNVPATRAALAEAGCRVSGPGYAETLRALCPQAVVSILNVADGDHLPPGVGLADFDGVAWTGSSLNVYDDTPATPVPAIRAQVELMREALAAGAPVFGSCWGLQVAAVATGGSVRRNPKGREFGIARGIALTQAGVTHPMFRGKGPVFSATAIHTDEVESLPPGALVLAGNAMSRVQAAEIPWSGGTFWGVQYHPEFDIAEIGLYGRRYAAGLAREGFFADADDALAWAAACAALKNGGRRDLAWRLGVDGDILEDGRRLRELSNWLATLVLPRAARR